MASRTVRPVWNASAISEYLSAGTFLGLSGLVLLDGARGFWFPIGYAAGCLLVLAFVAAPLRRGGAYTIPDFIEARLGSTSARRVASIAVLVIGWLYIVPRYTAPASPCSSCVAGMGGSRPPWRCSWLRRWPRGGMRAITYVQAFQYWLSSPLSLVPVVFIAFALSGGPHDFDPRAGLPGRGRPLRGSTPTRPA